MKDKKVLGKTLDELIKENTYEKIRGLKFSDPIVVLKIKLNDEKKLKEHVH